MNERKHKCEWVIHFLCEAEMNAMNEKLAVPVSSNGRIEPARTSNAIIIIIVIVIINSGSDRTRADIVSSVQTYDRIFRPHLQSRSIPIN